jgi:hypothetical protein
MNTGIYNSSAVDNYILEQSRREQEITRTRSIENYIKEAPYILLAWGGKLLAVALLIMCIGWAISNALSFDQNTSNITKTMNGMSHAAQNDLEYGSDELIDVEELLEGSDISDFNDNQEVQSTAAVVRDYYIFDTIDFAGDTIDSVTVGRVYEDPSSPSISQYCYVDVPQINGTKSSFHFINIDKDVRTEKAITDEVARSLGVSTSELQRAKTHCTI